MKPIKIYIDFIKISQQYMAGHNKVKIFFQSLYKGIPYTKDMLKWNKLSREEKLVQYALGK